jgi:hypothetical protein
MSESAAQLRARSVLGAATRSATAALGRAAAWAEANVLVCLGAILAGQILLALGIFVFVMTRNHWLVYEGGDQIWFVTTGWLVAHGTIPYALLGWGWSMMLAPLTWISGPSFVSLLPLSIAFELLVLGPIGTLAVYDIGARVAGRVAGLWCAAFVAVAPVAVTPLFVHRYRGRWVDEMLSGYLGFNQLGDYPSTVVVLVAAALVLRSLDRGRWREAVLAGTMAGFAIGIKPANTLFLAGPALAYLLARRWGSAGMFALALVPAVVTLTVWKYRGRGDIPLFANSLGETHLAAGSDVPLPLADSYLHRIPIHLSAWKENMSNLREFFWSARLAQWAPFAGALAVARRSLPATGLLLGWMLGFVFVKGSSDVASIEANSFWRLVMPGLPAYGILVAAVPLLIPTLPRRLGPRIAAEPVRPVGKRLTIAVVAVVSLIPLLVVLAESPSRGPDRALVWNGIMTPIDGNTVRLTVTHTPAGERLIWTDATKRARTFYRIFRTAAAGTDTSCGRLGADRCTLETTTLVDVTRSHSYVDPQPVNGATYRIGVAANWEDDTAGGDVFVISPPVSARW